MNQEDIKKTMELNIFEGTDTLENDILTKIKELRDKGLSWRKMEKELNIPQSTIRRKYNASVSQGVSQGVSNGFKINNNSDKIPYNPHNSHNNSNLNKDYITKKELNNALEGLKTQILNKLKEKGDIIV